MLCCILMVDAGGVLDNPGYEIRRQGWDTDRDGAVIGGDVPASDGASVIGVQHAQPRTSPAMPLYTQAVTVFPIHGATDYQTMTMAVLLVLRHAMQIMTMGALTACDTRPLGAETTTSCCLKGEKYVLTGKLCLGVCHFGQSPPSLSQDNNTVKHSRADTNNHSIAQQWRAPGFCQTPVAHSLCCDWTITVTFTFEALRLLIMTGP